VNAAAKVAVDSSIAIAALLCDHDAHEAADDALSRSTTTIAHVAVETYSVLTRLPAPLRLEAVTAAEIIAARLPAKRLTLDANAHVSSTARLAEAGVSGGATYDGLIALAAIEHDLELLSRDHRAARSYRALGARYRLVG
jgi:predicted nucleic acid-binding protein